MKIIQIFFLFNIYLNLSACNHLQRSNESGFKHYSEVENAESEEGSFYNPETFRSTYRRKIQTQLPPADLLKIEKRRRLRQLESALSTSKEKQQYAKILPLLRNDEEKIQFLEFPNTEERHNWIQTHGILMRSQTLQTNLKNLVENQDIATGMTQELVRKSWGEPLSIEVSGNPLYKNERWKYQRSITLNDGFKDEKRYIYFENGRVVGWETE